jgi:hypothetical protein
MIEFYSVESREIRISGFRPEFGFCHNINIRITVHPQEALLILGEQWNFNASLSTFATVETRISTWKYIHV